MSLDTSSIWVRAGVGVVCAALFWIGLVLTLAALEFTFSASVMQLIGFITVVITLVYIGTGRRPVN